MATTPCKLHDSLDRDPELLLSVMNELPEFWKGLGVANRVKAILEFGIHQAVGRLSDR